MSSASEDLKARQQRWANEASSAKTYPHWTLFEVIEEDLQAFSRQVEFALANFPTYSIALLRLYLSICSEIDVIAKLLCERIETTLPKRPNMDDYRKSLKTNYPKATVTDVID